MNVDGRAGLRYAFIALSYAQYRRFAASLILASLGAQLIQTAILWHVYELTGSALLLGLTGLARAAPHIALSLLGGVVADRVDRVRLTQGGQLLNGLLLLALAMLTIGGAAEVWHLYVVSFLNSAFIAGTQPARTALIPSLIPTNHLVNALALNSTIQQASHIIGPALAGVAIATVDLGPTYLVNSVAYLAAMFVISPIRPPALLDRPGESSWHSLVDGLKFVRQRRVIISLLLLDLAQTILGSYRALLPVFAASLGLGAIGFGMLSAAPGMGALFGAMGILALGDMRYKGLFTVFGVLAYCGALIVLALSSSFVLSLLAAGMLGATNVIQAIPRNSAILTMSPIELRGRVEGFRSMLAGGGPPLGYTFSGVLAAILGAPLALVGGAIACTAMVAVIFLSQRELRDADLGAAPVTVLAWAPPK